jgi:uracil-DNA glycosylase
MNNNFCNENIYKDISVILSKHLICSNINLNEIYEKMKEVYDQVNKKNEPCFYVLKKDIIGYGELLNNKPTGNLGIDLPIYFGNSGSQRRIMIVAMDPKRNKQLNDSISIGSVFALNQKKDRETKTNDYWKFIEPLTDNALVYLTDVYKLYYESFVLKNNKQIKILSNKDPDFISKKSVPFNTNKLILEAEINLVKPDIIISLGNESAKALKIISNIKTTNIDIMHNGISYLFMPHISRTVTQSIPTIANLFIALGKIKKDAEFESIGNQIFKLKGKLFKNKLDN